jgi:small subunit ribosomal protein S2
MGGIADMNRLPGALYIVDIKKEHLAVKEAKTLGIPVIAIVDTNTDPRDVDFPIPANDDSLKTIALISKVIADGVAMGREVSKANMMDEMSAEDRELKESGAEARDETQVRSRRRTRSRRGEAGGEGAEGGTEGAAEAAPAPEAPAQTAPQTAPQAAPQTTPPTEGMAANEASQGA